VWVGKWLGILTGAISLYNIGLKLSVMPVTEVFQRILEFYRYLVHPFAALLAEAVSYIFLHLMGIQLPYIPRDVIVLYVLGAAATYRSDYDIKTGLAVSAKDISISVVEATLWPATIWFRGYDDKSSFLGEIAKVICALLIFLLFNIAAPSFL
jgi:hypothetical protein